MKVFLSELAESKLVELSEYLLEKWNLKTRNKFISKLTEKIKQISSQPESCPKSNIGAKPKNWSKNCSIAQSRETLARIKKVKY